MADNTNNNQNQQPAGQQSPSSFSDAGAGPGMAVTVAGSGAGAVSKPKKRRRPRRRKPAGSAAKPQTDGVMQNSPAVEETVLKPAEAAVVAAAGESASVPVLDQAAPPPKKRRRRRRRKKTTAVPTVPVQEASNTGKPVEEAVGTTTQQPENAEIKPDEAAEPAAPAAEEPAEKTEEKPAEEAVLEPAEEAVLEPVAEPVVETAVEPAEEAAPVSIEAVESNEAAVQPEPATGTEDEQPVQDQGSGRDDHAGSRYTYFAAGPYGLSDDTQDQEQTGQAVEDNSALETETPMGEEIAEPVAEPVQEPAEENAEPLQPVEENEIVAPAEDYQPAEEPPAEAEIVVAPPAQNKTPETKPVEKNASSEPPAIYKMAEKIVPAIQAAFGKILSGLKGVGPGLAKIFSVFRLRYFVILAILGGMGYGGYYVYSSGILGSAYNSAVGYFTPKTQEVINVIENPDDRIKYGIETALLFASNNGSANDRIPVQILMADFFGYLQEPKVQGETGISAATFYGELKDQTKEINDFIMYVKNLEKLQSLYGIDVYEMLNQTTARDKALLDYLAELKTARDESVEISRTIQLNIDDMKASFDSLGPEKTKYETDFFTAMEELKAEKSDVLLKGFVDIVQKQDALKARYGALTRLLTYYDNAMKRLNSRIQAVEQNQDALVKGIRVVDVPGGGIDFIIEPQAVKTTGSTSASPSTAKTPSVTTATTPK